MEATVILTQCVKSRLLYGVRVQKMKDGDWWRTWSFPIDKKRAKNEGYDKEQVQGNLYCTDEFLGCPYCGTKSFVQCNKCKKLTCWNGEKKLDCPWCGEHLDNIVVATEKFNISGGDI